VANRTNQNNSLYDSSDYPSRQNPEGAGKPKKKKRRRGVMSTIFKVLGTLLLIALCTGTVLCCFGAVYIKTVIVPIADLSQDVFEVGENSVMYYMDQDTGEYKELVTLLNTTSSIWVDYEEIPQDLVNAAVAIEDKRFWTHPGIDWRRTANAVLDMFTGQDISGGSTITQQLIKNLTNYNETTVKRKVTEIVRALRFTQNNSKKDTITWYLNVIPLGSGCEGVGSAALEYFGKDVSELSLAECASLISITNNPSKYGPYSPARVKNSEGEVWTARQWNKWRQENVLYQMLDQEMISQEEYEAAVAEELVFVRAENEEQPQEIYTWYEETVISDVTRDLKEKYQLSDNRIEQMLRAGGLKIYTCLDPHIQGIVEEIYTNRENLDYTSASGQQMHSSITIIDNATGNVVAIAGQFGEKTGNLLKNFANTSKRQPGSSIKPLSVYAPAIEMGLLSPISIVDDYPYNDSNETGWPINSGAAKYAGLTTVRTGLAKSVNTLAVRILADKVTPTNGFDFVENKFKIDLVDAKEVGDQIKSDIDVAPLSMGGLTDGVSSRDMAEAYATFPNNGIYTYSRTYTKVLDSSGQVILENEIVQEPVLKDTTAYYINSMLGNVTESGGTAAGYGISGMVDAGKTGTTSENYDRWFVGYTPYYTAAVWTGYEQNEKMTTKGNPALRLWNKVMERVHDGLENRNFPEPNGLTRVKFCLDSGLLPTEYCSMDPRAERVGSERVFEADAPTGNCTIHTAENVVQICLDCPILLEDETESGMYYLAGPNCPEDRVKEVCLPDFDREHIGTAVANDEYFRLEVVESYGSCTVHGEHQEEEPFDPFDPFNPLPPWIDGEEPTQDGDSGDREDQEQEQGQDVPPVHHPVQPPVQSQEPEQTGEEETLLDYIPLPPGWKKNKR